MWKVVLSEEHQKDDEHTGIEDTYRDAFLSLFVGRRGKCSVNFLLLYLCYMQCFPQLPFFLVYVFIVQ